MTSQVYSSLGCLDTLYSCTMNLASLVRPSQQGITLLKVQGRTFRIPTASLPMDYNVLVNQSSSSSSSEPALNSDSSVKNLNTIRIPIPANLYGAVIGHGGRNIKYIRANSGAQVDISNNENVVIIKGTQDQIDAARTLLDIRLGTAKSPNKSASRPTHFLSLPLTDETFIHKIKSLKNDILAMNLPDVDDSIFMPSTKMHATLGVSKLYKQEMIESAVETLKGLQEEVMALLGENGLIVKVKGLKYMDGNNKSARNAAVIYADMEEVEGEGKLKALCDLLITKHTEAGILERESRPLKLHITVINTIYRKPNAHSQSKSLIDARPILEKFGNVELGTIRLGSVHLCRMGGVDERGRYPSEGGIRLPQ